MIKSIPPYFKNFYIVVSILFVVWMIFFDPNDVISQYKMRKDLKDLEHQEWYYQTKIVEVNEEHEALFSDKKKLEQFARENYLMKKDNEDVIVIQMED